MIGIIDYGAGNLFSVKNTLDFLKVENLISKNQQELSKCDGIILPGVGAFPKAIKQLKSTNLIDFIKEYSKTKPLMGICLGMQMLFDSSDEFAFTKGLGLIDGSVSKLITSEKIPHMGWNNLIFNKDSDIIKELSQESVYFVHSFMANTSVDNVVAYCEHGTKIPSIVQNKNVYGCQFHPEKSGDYGLKILKNFGDICYGFTSCN